MKFPTWSCGKLANGCEIQVDQESNRARDMAKRMGMMSRISEELRGPGIGIRIAVGIGRDERWLRAIEARAAAVTVRRVAEDQKAAEAAFMADPSIENEMQGRSWPTRPRRCSDTQRGRGCSRPTPPPNRHGSTGNWNRNNGLFRRPC